MNLAKLFEMQRELDQRIVQEKGLEGQDLVQEKILALYVELGELSNELPEVFKYWSDKKNNYEKALKEYVDCLHFILSIGLVKGYTPVIVDILKKANSITYQFNGLYRRISVFNQDPSLNNYHEVLMVFKGLGEMLGFTWEQIEQAYLEKNAENHRRQEEGY